MAEGKSLKVVILLFILGIPFFFIGGFILFPLLYLFWKYVKFCIKIDLFVIYIAARLPIWLTIEFPLSAFGWTSDRIENFYKRARSMFSVRRKTSISIFVLIFLFVIWVRQPPLTGSSVGAIPALTIEWLKVIFYSLLGSFFLLGVISTVKGVEKPSEVLFGKSEREVVGDTVKSPLEAHRKAAEGVDETKGVYNDLRQAEPEETARSLIPSDIRSRARNILGMFQGSGGGAGAGATRAAAISATAIIGLILVSLVIFGIQLFFLLGYIISFYQFIGGPILGAIGVGGAYGSFITNEIADQYFAGIQVQLEDEVRMMQQARQRVYCVFKGPACLRQWQLNNTKQPGSEEVGESYGLKIDRFEVGSGSQVDIAYKNGDYKLPVSFGLSNNRHGLKGINALNVSYRAKIIDFDRGRNDPFCSTGWKPINGFDINSADDTAKYNNNDLYPGTSASTGFLTFDQLNLRNCEMVQPGAGETRTVLLQVKYDYASQATLYFDAMSQQNLQQNPEINENFKPSETADTPVKAVLNVQSPVLFDEAALGTGENAARRFSVRTRLNTDERDVEYRVRDLRIINSEEIEFDPDIAGSRCDFEKKDDNILRLNSDAEARLEKQQSGDEDSGALQTQSSWFTASNPPSFFGCQGGFRLENPEDITPTGETLNMDVEANYTVRLNEKIDQFRILNTRCSTYNCPLLVTRSYAENNPIRESSDEDKHGWKDKCDGVDAGNGCEVVKGPPENPDQDSGWSTIKLMTGGAGDGQTRSQRLDSQLETGEVAVSPKGEGSDNPFLNLVNDEDISRMKKKMESDPKETAFGLKERKITELKNILENRGKGFAIFSDKKEGGRDVQTVTFGRKEVKRNACEYENGEVKYPTSNSLGNFTSEWDPYETEEKENPSDILIALDKIKVDCQDEGGSGDGGGDSGGTSNTGNEDCEDAPTAPQCSKLTECTWEGECVPAN